VQFNRKVNMKKMQAGTESIGLADRLGQNADVIAALFRNADCDLKKEAVLKMLKNRDGALIDLTIEWDFEKMSFAEKNVALSGVSPASGAAAPGKAPAPGDLFDDDDVLVFE
jgi:hypothetical protein